MNTNDFTFNLTNILHSTSSTQTTTASHTTVSAVTTTPNLNMIKTLLEQPLLDLLLEAQSVHRKHFTPNKVELSSITSIKTGTCPEDCKYCPQSGHYKTDISTERLISLEKLKAEVKEAKARGASRFCMGAAWRTPPAKAMDILKDMIKIIKDEGLISCLTAGMVTTDQATELKTAGLDYYNHNLDTSREYYPQIITTRTYDDRLETIANLRKANIKVCCGGILGLGETHLDRIAFINELYNMSPPPESIPINLLMPVKGTPLEKAEPISPIDLIKVIATIRILMPTSSVRLSAGRKSLTDEAQILCFMAGANSIWRGDAMLTQKNPGPDQDDILFKKIGITHDTLL